MREMPVGEACPLAVVAASFFAPTRSGALTGVVSSRAVGMACGAMDVCDTCQKPNPPLELRRGGQRWAHFCSLECLQEWAFAQRDKQPKLSKSRDA